MRNAVVTVVALRVLVPGAALAAPVMFGMTGAVPGWSGSIS
jgi:hypothetical protein